MKYVDIRDLPPCSLSPQCLRLIDDLDIPPTVPAATRFAYIEDLQDERHLRQLRSHVHGCPTCSALLIEARRLRTQQRMMLYHYMVANERQVPATSGAIFEAIRREKSAGETSSACKIEAHAREQRASKRPASGRKAAFVSLPIPLYARPFSARRLFQNMLTLATVAAVVLAAFGLLNRFAVQPGTFSNSAAHPSSSNQEPRPGSGAYDGGWSSVMIGLTVLSAGMVQSLTFANYDTKNGQMMTLVSTTQTLASANIDGVSGDGLSFVYERITPNQRKAYFTVTTIPFMQAHSIYQTSADQGGNAVWMDTTHILLQTVDGSIQALNALTGATQRSWSLHTGSLMFYRRPFLYFVGAKNLEVDALYRANLSQANPVPQRITNPLPDTRFWLSLDGTTIFYANHDAPGKQGIYAVGSDGSHARLLRSGSAIPIGYAAGNALIVLDEVQNKFQIIKMGTTAGAPEKVIMADAAPGSVSLCSPPDPMGVIKACDQNIALAPYGHGLVLNARYANGTSNLVYDNLDTGASRVIFSLPAGASAQLPGWSRIPSTSTGVSGGLAA